MPKENLTDSDPSGKIERSPDGVIEFETSQIQDARMVSEVEKFMEINVYNGALRNCVALPQSAIQDMEGKIRSFSGREFISPPFIIPGTLFPVPGVSVLTPNELYNDSLKIDNATEIKTPAPGAMDYKFHNKIWQELGAIIERRLK